MRKSASWLPRISLAIALPIAAAEAQWTAVNQPTGVSLRDATILSDGAWVGIGDGNGIDDHSWISTDRGTTWLPFRDFTGNASYSVEVLGAGVVATDFNPNDTCWGYLYEPDRKTWVSIQSDRYVRKSVSATEEISTQNFGGTHTLAIYVNDSVFAFQSTDSARTWKLIAAVSGSEIPGNAQDNSDIAGGRLWLEDTVRRVARGTLNGKDWLEIPFPVGVNSFHVADTLPEGGWLCLAKDSAKNRIAKFTRDFGKTWSDYDMTIPGSVGKIELSNDWTLGYAFLAGKSQTFLRPRLTGTWMAFPQIDHVVFVDGGKAYGLGSSGLMSLDLGVLGVRQASGRLSKTVSWRLQGSDIVLTGSPLATGWEIRNASGRNLSRGRFAGTSDLRIPTGGRKGLLMVRLTGSENRAFPVLVP